MSSDHPAEYGWNTDMGVPLMEKLKADLKTALRGKNTEAKNTIRQIISEYPTLTIPLTLESGKKSFRLKKPDEITDEEILGIIQGLAKSEKTVLEFKNEATSDYLGMLELYLPRMATRAEIEEWVTANINFSDFKSPMQAMGPIMKHFGKLADGKLVKEVLQGLSEN
ncbi:MAG: GatB/YqeY domain-containing protein [Deltaproteobacteria bacterium]|nr:GatB/YqeY domain-containing protein [Deltaproteobacteria bacterium]